MRTNLTKRWSPVGDRIKTKWAKDVDPAKAWPEYPRPQLERKIWVNLNGLWDYSITDIKANEPKKIDGQILVPFPVESSLSGVQKAVNDRQALWYKRHFTADVGNELLILNLDAVDYDAHVFLNGHSVGEHKGGYNRFSFDVTKFLNANQENRLVLKVTDATENGSQPIGKQRQRPNGML
jgi:beta-galactosidase/beta-glucuronidase